MQNIVLVNNSRTVWSTKFDCFSKFFRQLASECLYYFSKKVSIILTYILTINVLNFGSEVISTSVNHITQIQGVRKLTLPFLNFVVLKVNLPLEHQNPNLLEETCRILLISNMYQLVTS